MFYTSVDETSARSSSRMQFQPGSETVYSMDNNCKVFISFNNNTKRDIFGKTSW